jgi:hypothetical protein
VFYSTIFIFVLTVASQAGERSKEEVETRNMEIVRKAHASLAADDLEAFKTTIGPNYVRHCPAMPPGLQELHGTEEFFGFLEEWLRAAPDYTDTISNMRTSSCSGWRTAKWSKRGSAGTMLPLYRSWG